MEEENKDEELHQLISLIIESYVQLDFKENIQVLDNDLKKAFELYEDGKYTYYGLSSKFGIWEDLRLHYELSNKGE